MVTVSFGGEACGADGGRRGCTRGVPVPPDSTPVRELEGGIRTGPEAVGTHAGANEVPVWHDAPAGARAGPQPEPLRGKGGQTATFAEPTRFDALEVEEACGEEAVDGGEPLAGSTEAGAPRLGAKKPRRGPRSPREVRDLEAFQMRPVPMRRRSENPLVLEAHARFLQHVFRRTRRLAVLRGARTGSPPTAWGKSGLRGLLPVYRPVHRPRCTDGLANEDDFEEQGRRARRVLMWYRQYSELLKKLLGRQPEVVDLFCGEGGVSEGIRRAGLSPFGVDVKEMSKYRERFGADRFLVADAYLPDSARQAIGRTSAIGVGASPPCQSYSTVLADGTSATTTPGLPQIAATMRELGLPFWVENVLGADATELDEQMTVLRGPMFGLPVDRGRRFWTSFELRIDMALAEGGRRLRQRSCLGPRRRWMRLDPFGRPIRHPCCRGNLYPVQGRAPTRSTVEENARAMGVDPGHMSWSGLSQSIPPTMAELVAGQLAMHVACSRFGAPRISYDDFEARPSWARRLMRRWLRGVGDDAAEAGLELVGAAAEEAGAPPGGEAVSDRGTSSDPRWTPAPEPGGPAAAADSTATWCDVRWGLPEASWRELHYSFVGDYSQSVLEPQAPWWASAMHGRSPVAPDELTEELLLGENTFVHCSLASLERGWGTIEQAMKRGLRGTRITVVLPRGGSEQWADRAWRAGLEELHLPSVGVTNAGDEVKVPWGPEGRELKRLPAGYRVFYGGRPAYAAATMTLDHAAVEPSMDPRDRGIGDERPELKAALSYTPIDHDPERWRGKGFPPFVEQLMTEGHRIGGDEPFGFYEIDQYKWRDATAQRMGGLEADRHVLVGALEYVSAEEATEILTSRATVHPWTVVNQKDKWRACQDYSKGTNLEADTAPFRLPSVFDVRRIIKADSHFAKWDLRDGFFHVPIHPDSRNRMLVRHPVSGLLMRCRRLPFGYVDSPRCFCAMTEAVAQKFRERAARAGIRAHIFVYVDDALIVGDTEEETRRASRIFEALLAELGLQWAPHKRRGPARVIEFLGMLICNDPGAPRCIGLTRRRQEALRERLDAWLARRPASGSDREEEVDPKDLATLLGHLVFASQVMPHGRIYMQGMLASFAGLEVDWRRGAVRLNGGRWGAMTVGAHFWRDLDWWDHQLSTNNCVPLAPTGPAGAAVQAGTDASDFGAGEVIYLGGQREETRLKFTQAEKRRPINWRELLGILRVLEVWGPRLEGCRLLVETDNMVAWATGSRGHSKAPDMQELLRRLCERAARWRIDMTLTHQPGAKLDRPDQVSRGSAVEEPRVRLNAEIFKTIERSFGPFTEFLGAEREHPTPRRPEELAAPAAARCFVHPTFATVGSALRLFGERLRSAAPGSYSGIMVLPYAPEAQWWKLLKHFRVVAHLGPSQKRPHLEANSLSVWRPLAAHRATLIVAFPRSAGPKALPVAIDWVERAPEEPGYTLCPPMPDFGLGAGESWPGVDRRFTLSLPRGSMVYSLPNTPGDFGTLYLLVEDFSPANEEEAFGPIAAELLRDGRPKAKAADGRVGVLIDSKESYDRSGAPYQPVGTELFVVSHHVERAEVPESRQKGWDRVTDYFFFNMSAAEKEIRSYLARVDDQPIDATRTAFSDTSSVSSESGPIRGRGSRSAKSGRDSSSSGPASASDLTCSGMAVVAEMGEPRQEPPKHPDPWERPLCACPKGCYMPAAVESDAGLLCEYCSEGQRCSCEGDCVGPNGHPCCSGRMQIAPMAWEAAQVGMPMPGEETPECAYPGCEALRQVLSDQSGYAAYCTGAMHPPSPRPMCQLLGCTGRSHPKEDFSGWHDYCGRSHGRLAEQRRAAAEREALNGPLVQWGPALDRQISGAGLMQISRSDGIICRGCDKSIRMGTQMEVCAEGFIHPEEECRACVLWRRAFTNGGRVQTTPVPTAMASDLQKRARVRAQLSDRRMEAVRRCLEGGCSLRHDPTEPKNICRGGCGRTLHQRCADLSKGYYLKGALTCVECRLRAMGAEGNPSESLLNEVAQLMIIELTEGREATSATHSAFVTLSEKWVAEKLQQGMRRIASPTENLESFKQFAKWMVITADRERSFLTTMRAAGGYFERAGKPNFTKDPAVKALVKELEDKISTDSQPRSHGTRRMLREAIAYIEDTHGEKPYMMVREKVGTINEAVGCLRAVESCAAVEKHGLSANDCFILRDLQTGEVSVELKVHDSKTHFSRYVNMSAETTTSKIKVADAYSELFRVNRLHLVEQVEGGFHVLSPDSWAVRLSLLGLEASFSGALEAALREYERHDPMAKPLTTCLLTYAKRAWRAKTGGENHKYVLLNEGPRNWEGHEHLIRCLQRYGLGKRDQDITLVPAPLLRSTHHGGRLLTPMPQTYSGAHANMGEVFREAFARANPRGDPDPELDRQGHEKLVWGQHSWRRLGEKVARDSKAMWEKEGVTATDVDKYSDWNQKEHSKDMQIHYSGEQRSFRVRRRFITRAM